MKYLIFGTLAFLLLLSQTTQAQAQQWEEIDEEELEFGSHVPGDLLDVAVGYVSQKGKFESTKARFPGDYYSVDKDSVKYESRTTSTRIYYRYNFLLTEDGGPSAVNANVTISYNPSNSNFIVTSYHYKIDYDGNEGNEGQNEEVTEDVRDMKYYLVDTRIFTGDNDLAKDLNEAFDEIIPPYFSSDLLNPDANHKIHYVYRAYSRQFDGDEDFNEEGFPGAKIYDIWVKFKSSEGDYYLMVVNLQYDKNETTGAFGPEISNYDGTLML